MSLVAYASSEESDSESEMAPESSGGLHTSLPPTRKDVTSGHAEALGYSSAYARQSPGEQEQHSPGFYPPPGVYGLGYPPGYAPPPPPNFSSSSYGSPGYPSSPGYGGYSHSNHGGPSFSTLGYSHQGPNTTNFPPPGMNLPPPQGGHGMALLPPHSGPGLNHPPPQGGPNMKVPPPQGGSNMNLPPPQSGPGMNHHLPPPPPGGPGLNLSLPPQGCPNMNLPPPSHTSTGLNLPPPQGVSGLCLPPPQNSHGLTLPPPQSCSGLNLSTPQGSLGMTLSPSPQSGNGNHLPHLMGGHTMTLPQPQGSGGVNLLPPTNSPVLNIPPPQQSSLSSMAAEPRIALPPPKVSGQGMKLPPPENENTKPKKRLEPVKISVPELRAADSDSDEEEPSRKKKASQSTKEAFGLSSLLPQPKNAPGGDFKRQLLPYAFTKKVSEAPSDAKLSKGTPLSKPKITAIPEISNTPSPSAIKAAAKNAALQVTKQITQEEDDDSDDELHQGNFFSLSEGKEIPPLPSSSEHFTYPLPSINDDGPPGVDPTELQSDAANAPLEFKTAAGQVSSQQWPVSSGDDYNNQEYNQYPESSNSSEASYYSQGYYGSGYYQEQPSSTQDSMGSDSFMDDEAFKRLQGKRNRGREEINFVEIKGDDQLSGNQQWLTKALTEEKNMKSFSKKKGEQPTGQQRRKHQITYLIHQAKERELELKNTWSDNKMSRRQTQAKYGF
ncbi:proline-rich protein PRCC [Hyla sarda]|uniref:proline-rich protein PRCC n=1 Tax=Hyla sarda TaxID=327740 RepID=UPI0024C35D1F|nr:proline-rich protein PRCC [Hyla sarda]